MGNIIQNLVNKLVCAIGRYSFYAPNWYAIGYKNDFEGWGPENQHIFEEANNMGIVIGQNHHQGVRVIGVHCTNKQLNILLNRLGKDDYGYAPLLRIDAEHIRKECKNLYRCKKINLYLLMLFKNAL